MTYKNWDLTSYSTLLRPFKIKVKIFLGVRNITEHFCKEHGKFSIIPASFIYTSQSISPCPVCKKSQKKVLVKVRLEKFKTTILNRNRPIKLFRYAQILEKCLESKANLLCSRKEFLENQTSKIKIKCNCGEIYGTNCNTNPKFYRCRSCLNKEVNSKKNLDWLPKLVKEYPDVKILKIGKSSVAGPRKRPVTYECKKCRETVIKPLNLFQMSTTHYCERCLQTLTNSKHSSPKIWVTHKPTAKKFLVQGYELLALKELTKTLDIGKVKGAQEIPPINYVYAGKPRRYFPDLQYKNTLIEVKSLYTSGVYTSNYYNWGMLKKKAIFCMEQGYRFKLMLFSHDKKLLKLPEKWWEMKLVNFQNFLRIRLK